MAGGAGTSLRPCGEVATTAQALTGTAGSAGAPTKPGTPEAWRAQFAPLGATRSGSVRGLLAGWTCGCRRSTARQAALTASGWVDRLQRGSRHGNVAKRALERFGTESALDQRAAHNRHSHAGATAELGGDASAFISWTARGSGTLQMAFVKAGTSRLSPANSLARGGVSPEVALTVQRSRPACAGQFLTQYGSLATT